MTFFQKIKKEYDFYQQERVVLIGLANEILRKAKESIFSLHRGNILEASKALKDGLANLKNLERRIKKLPALEFEGSYRAAMEEYIEAYLFYGVVKNKKIKEIDQFKISFTSYLAALSDLTGEILRKMVLLASQKKFKEVKIHQEIISQIVRELLNFDLTGYLRLKYDQAKRNLTRAEEILYEIEIRNR